MISLDGFEISLLSYVGIFIGVLLAYDAVWQILSRQESRTEARNRRLRMIARGASGDDVLQILKPRAVRSYLSALPVIGNLPQDLRQAGITQSPRVVVLGCLVAAVATAMVTSLRLPPLFAIAVAFALWTTIPLLLLRAARTKRTESFTQQLPDALDLMARGLRVGHPLNVTIASVAEEMADPIASEFGVMVDQIAYGDDLIDAVMDLAERMPTDDVQYLASSVGIQHGTGGDLARMLMTLSGVIRDRITLRKKVKAITAEGRLTATILSAIPLIMFGLMSVLVPNYYGGLVTDPTARSLGVIIIILVIANAVILRRLVNFKV